MALGDGGEVLLDLPDGVGGHGFVFGAQVRGQGGQFAFRNPVGGGKQIGDGQLQGLGDGAQIVGPGLGNIA
ncbi:hypothetical protein ACFWDA_11360 [Rhodococcus zopfii]|uniref:hypothetical protein n=1 Tax=Rhodococcus zopfii TaxID=43772 RepID=UPI00365769E4